MHPPSLRHSPSARNATVNPPILIFGGAPLICLRFSSPRGADTLPVCFVRDPLEFVEMGRVTPWLPGDAAEFAIFAMHGVALDAAGKFVSLIDRGRGREHEPEKAATFFLMMQQEPHPHRSNAVGRNQFEARPLFGLG